jgi:hypothetical protein
VIALFFAALAILSAAFTCAAYRSGEMRVRGGGTLRADRQPRVFHIVLALRALTAATCMGVAVATAMGWIQFAPH